MTATASKIASWQDLESRVDDHLKAAQRSLKLAYHRFYDTKSAGNLLPAQPADFLVTFRGATTLIEAKYSAVHDSLRSCFSNHVKGHQLASARIWSRAGARYLLLFYSHPGDQVEIWDGMYCVAQRSLGKPLALVERHLFPSVETALAEQLGYA